MSVAPSVQQHKVFLQKRSIGTEQPAKSCNMQAKVSCSLCTESFPGAKELGLHILTAHCGGEQEEEPDSLIIEGSPGIMMEVEEPMDHSVDPLESEEQGDHSLILQARPSPSLKLPALNLPRQPTPSELKQKFMVYRLSDTSSRFICLVCDKMYTSRYNIRMHMNLHSGNNVHKCAFCGRNFAHKHVYESHVRTHTGERPFSCGKCDRRFGDRSNCSSHRKRCLGVAGQTVTPPTSPQGLGGMLPQGQSITIAPNVSITPIAKSRKDTSGESGIFEYPEMNNSTMEDLALTFEPQIVSVTGGGDELTNMGYTGEDDEEEEEEEDVSEEMMIEPDISLDYDDIEELMEEPERDEEKLTFPATIMTVQKPVSTTIFTCSFCNVKYSQQTMLLEHLTTHIDIPTQPKQNDLDQGYMAIYYSSRPKFMCLSCGKLFATSESVNLHLNIHYEDKIYACEHCDKIFGHKHVYENHRKVAHSQLEVQGKCMECQYCGNAFPTPVSRENHERSCGSRPSFLTSFASSGEESSKKLILKINTPMTINKNTQSLNNNDTVCQEAKKSIKPKANRPPPKLILLNSDTSEYQKTNLERDVNFIIKKEETNDDDEEDDDHSKSMSVTLAPKPTMTLLSEEAKKIFNTSAPPQRRSSGSNPRAHKIVETDQGREYIPDTNSNNILQLEAIYPPADGGETKKGYMLRPVGPGGQQRYICVDCGKHYTTSYNVRMHRNIHLGKNLYTCQFCQKEFSHKHVWETHERVHTGERPFKCPTCPKDFADRSNYNSHKKICLRLQQQAFGGGAPGSSPIPSITFQSNSPVSSPIPSITFQSS